MYDDNNFEVNTLMKLPKTERNREGWEKYKGVVATKKSC